MPDITVVLDMIRTLATIAIPAVVAVLGHRLNRRLKLWEASQWRNQELIKARVKYYGELAPMINDLMCYLTFVGRWKDLTPPEVVAIKRDADRLFFSAAPLFSQHAIDAYRAFIRACFSEYTSWGLDALILSGFVRRREARPDTWNAEWEALFKFRDNKNLPIEGMVQVRDCYDRLLIALAEDIQLSEPRVRYATHELIFNAR